MVVRITSGERNLLILASDYSNLDSYERSKNILNSMVEGIFGEREFIDVTKENVLDFSDILRNYLDKSKIDSIEAVEFENKLEKFKDDILNNRMGWN